MNSSAAVAVEGAASPLAILVIRSHYRLPHKPQSTLEVLRVFFPGDAARLLDELRKGPVAVRRGDVRSIRTLAMALRAQGFEVDVDVRTPDDDGPDWPEENLPTWR